MTPLLLLAGCGLLGGPPAWVDEPHTAVRPVPVHPEAIPLFHRAAEGRYDLPMSSRPNNARAERRFALETPFVKHEIVGSTQVWRTPLPVHSNLLPTRTHGTHTFGADPPPDLIVRGPKGNVRFSRRGRMIDTWGFSRGYLFLGTRLDAPAPDPAEYSMEFPRAAERENALNLLHSGLAPADFAARNLTVGRASHTGLLLPAPARASWELAIPEGAVLDFRGTVFEPAIRGLEQSDGADVVVEILGGDAPVEAGRVALDVGAWQDLRADLSPWGGETVRLQLRVEPRASPLYDYAFLEAPTVFVPSEAPQRVLLAFVDTVRPDHLPMYGYERDTTPRLARWAQHGTVFEHARSVAPWTLPSARAALTGAQPELWYETDNLPHRMSQGGFHTEAFFTNAFLAQPFDTQVGWDRFEYDHLQRAGTVVDRALAVHRARADRDLLLLVHFMEPHLPYDEDPLQRAVFAGLKPDAVPPLRRGDLMRVKPDDPNLDTIKKYVVARYDNNLRVVDGALAPLIEALGPDAHVVLFSDHGEEFWDHGSFEHGHTFYDDLLRVPLVFRSPALPAGRPTAPVSLLDLTPTLLELAGLPSDVPHGRSLVGLAWGDSGEDEAFGERPQGFGRPLYGTDGWGVVARGHKWTSRGGTQKLYDLAADPAEQRALTGDLPDPAWPGALQTALTREVVRAWRVVPNGRLQPVPVTLKITHPEGIQQAWSAYDPRGKAARAAPRIVDGAVVIEQPRLSLMPEAVYVVPRGDALDPRGLELAFTDGGGGLTATVETGPLSDSAVRQVFLTMGNSALGASVDLTWVPLPEGVDVAGFHPDVADQLRELGYLDDERAAPPTQGDPR